MDDELVASHTSMNDKLTLVADPDNGEAIRVRFSALGRGLRATLFHGDEELPAKDRVDIGLGGLDLTPEPGSPAARREDRIRLHPMRHTLIATAGGVAKVVVPIVLAAVAFRFVIDIPWPDIDLPRIPWPSIPWPEIPWPQIP